MTYYRPDKYVFEREFSAKNGVLVVTTHKNDPLIDISAEEKSNDLDRHGDICLRLTRLRMTRKQLHVLYEVLGFILGKQDAPG